MPPWCWAFLLLLTAAGCTAPNEAESGENLVPTVKTVKSNGVECYRTDGVCYPTVFGEPQLTTAELTALLDGGDTLEMAMTVNTVPDALRLLRLRRQTGKDIDNQDAEDTPFSAAAHSRMATHRPCCICWRGTMRKAGASI